MGEEARKIEFEQVDLNRMSLDEAAEYITRNYRKIAPQTLYNRLTKGDGPHGQKILGRWQFRKVDIDSWVKAQTVVRKAFTR